MEGKGSNKTARKRSAQRGTQGKNVNYESRRKKENNKEWSGLKWVNDTKGGMKDEEEAVKKMKGRTKEVGQ